MGIWYDSNTKSDFPFITSQKQLHPSCVGLVKSPYQTGTLHKFVSQSNTFLLAVDGEVKNLTLLVETLALSSDNITDVIYALYLQEGSQGFFRIEGAVSIIVYDLKNEKTILYRAFLNGYPLYFTTKNNRLTVCTNPVFLLHREDISDAVNHDKIAKLFAVNPLNWTGSLFCELDVVEHGELVVINNDGMTRNKLPLKDIFSTRYTYNNEEISFDRYREKLSSAVNNSIVQDKKYGIMLSSGMDSSSIAYYAAKSLKSEGNRLVAYSWTLPGDSADESENIERICKALDIPLKMFNGEEFGSFNELDTLFLLPDTPFVNPFWRLNQHCYHLAEEDGINLLFNGNFADLLFRKRKSTVLKMYYAKRFDLVFSSLLFILKSKGFYGVLKSLKARISFSKKENGISNTPWLSNQAVKLLQKSSSEKVEETFQEYEAALCPFQAGYLGLERYLSGRYNVYRSEPHRDFDLMHYSLGFPVDLTHRAGKTKFFVRESMRGKLPNEILEQSRVGLLSSFVLKSFQKNLGKIREKIWENPSSWNVYVKEIWMKEKLKENALIDNRDLYVIWLCIHLTAWLTAIKPGGSLYEGEGIIYKKKEPRREVEKDI